MNKSRYSGFDRGRWMGPTLPEGVTFGGQQIRKDKVMSDSISASYNRYEQYANECKLKGVIPLSIKEDYDPHWTKIHKYTDVTIGESLLVSKLEENRLEVAELSIKKQQIDSKITAISEESIKISNELREMRAKRGLKYD